MENTSKITVIGVSVLTVAMLVIILLVAGGDEDSPAPAGGTAASTAPDADPQAVELFSDTCGQCHTLTAAGTDGDVGPNLDDIAFDRERVLTTIENGAGNGQMPAGLLEGADAEAVAELVAGDDPTLAEPDAPAGEG